MVQILTKLEGVGHPLDGLFPQGQHLTDETLTVLIGIVELALDAQGLRQATRLQIVARRLLQHGTARCADQNCGLTRLIERSADQQADDEQKTKASQQSELPLDGQAGKGGHHRFLVTLCP